MCVLLCSVCVSVCGLDTKLRNLAVYPKAPAAGHNTICPTTGELLLASLAIFSRSEAALKRRKNFNGFERAGKRLFNRLALGKTSQARDTCQFLDMNPASSGNFRDPKAIPRRRSATESSSNSFTEQVHASN